MADDTHRFVTDGLGNGWIEYGKFPKTEQEKLQDEYRRWADKVNRATDFEMDNGIAAPARPERVKILQEGASLTAGERDAEYGPPSVNMAASGELKAVFRKHIRRDISAAELEAIDMALTKLGRIATGQSPKRDTYVDCATYIAIAGEIALTK